MRSQCYIETEKFDYFDDWLINLTKWLMAQEDKRKFKVTTSKKMYAAGEGVFFRGEAYDDSYNPLSGVEVKVNVQGQDGKDHQYYLSEPNKGQYSLSVNNLTEGNYSFSAEGKKNEVSIGKDNGFFSIGKSTLEHVRLQADKSTLQQIALRTGGKFLLAKDLGTLTDSIKKTEMKPLTEFKKSRKGFHAFPWILFILLGLASIEWIIRKWYSLL